MLRAIKIRLYPNKAQEQTLNKVLGCYRFVYNHMLALKQKEYNENKISLGLCELSKYFHHELLKDEQYPWLKEQNTQIMQQSIRQMLTAYDNFFKQHKGFPKYKSKKDKQSALFTTNAISRTNTFETRHISLTTPLKNLKFRCSDLYFKRLQKYNKNIRRATLSKTKSGNFFLSVLIEMEDAEAKKFTAEDIRFTVNNGCIYAICLNMEGRDSVCIKSLARTVDANKPDFSGIIKDVEILGYNKPFEWSRDDEGLKIRAVNIQADTPVVLKVHVD